MLMGQLQKVENLVMELFENPFKIDGCLCATKGNTFPTTEKSAGAELTAKILMDAPDFDDEIKTFIDVPSALLWSVLQKQNNGPISHTTISAWMQQLPQLFHQAFTGNQRNYFLVT